MGTFLDWLFERPLESRSVIEAPPAPMQGSGVLPPSRDRLPLAEADMVRTIAVYRAVQLLAGAAGQLSIDVTRGPDPIDRPALIRRPDVDLRDLPDFVKRTVASLALTGNAYWRVTRNARNEATNLTILDPHECEPLEDGRLGWSRTRQPLEPSAFQHLGLLRLPGELKALGPIQAARVELTGAVRAAEYGTAFHTKGDVPTGLLTTDQVLSAEQSEEFKQRWQSRQPHEVAVLGKGITYKPVLLSPEDAQFIQTRQFDTTAVARLFGIPAHMFLAQVSGSSLTYTNMAQADLAFVRWTLMDYLREIETAFSAVLPGTQEARFNVDGLIRPDTKTRYEAHEIALRAGFLTVDEVRAIEGLPAITTPTEETLDVA